MVPRVRTIWTVAAALLALAAPAWANDAEVWRGDASRSGATEEVVPPSGLGVLWETVLPGGDIYTTACVGGGRLYIGSASGKAYCLSASDGTLLWSFRTGAPITATPAYYKGRLYLGSHDGHMYILHGATGEILGDILHGGIQNSSPLIVDDILYFCPGYPSKDLRAYDALTGAALWSYPAGQIIWSSPTYANGNIVVGNNAGKWYAFPAGAAPPAEPLWTYETGGYVYYASAAAEGNIVVLCPGGQDSSAGPYDQRGLHVLNAADGSLIKKVLVKPPVAAVEKAGGTGVVIPDVPEAPPPTALVQEFQLESLMTMDKEGRDAYLDGLAEKDGIDYQPLKDWLDVMMGDAPVVKVMKDGTFNFSYPAQTSSPVIRNGIVYITHRELAWGSTQDFYTVAIDTDPAALEDVVWGTQLQSLALEQRLVLPSPTATDGGWIYAVHGNFLQARQLADGVKVAEADFGVLAMGSPVLANGRVFLAGMGGKVAAFQTGNQPPLAPTAFAPSGGENIPDVSQPTLVWSGQFDVESPVAELSTELQIGVGYANRDVELSADVVELAAGSSSYMFPSAVSPNTHVYWRVRVRDPQGAYSPWSPVQDFWVSRDADIPDPPSDFEAVPGNGVVRLAWNPSPSPDVMFYRLRWKASGDAWPDAFVVDAITGTEHTVSGLTNGSVYDFMLVAVDEGENESSPVYATAMPQPMAQIVGGAEFPTLEDALAAAVPGDIVQLTGETYYGDFVIPPGVSLAGVSPRHTILMGTGSGTVLSVQGTYGTDPATTISDLTVRNGATGVDAGTAEVILERVIIHGMSGHAVIAAAGGMLSVVNCTLMSNSGDGVYSLAETAVRNTIVGKNGGYGVNAPEGSMLTYIDAYENAMGNYLGGESGVGCFYDPAIFRDEASFDFTVDSNSPTVDAGDPFDDYTLEPSPNGGRINLGAYGGTPWAATTPAPPSKGPSAPGSRRRGGRCGSVGLDLMLPVLALMWMRRRRRRR